MSGMGCPPPAHGLPSSQGLGLAGGGSSEACSAFHPMVPISSRPAELPSPGPLPAPHLHGGVSNMAENGCLILTAKPPECFPISANGNAIFPVAQTKIWELSLVPLFLLQPVSHP